jgi:hypothetical protein
LGIVLILFIFSACSRFKNTSEADLYLAVQRESMVHRSYYIHVINAPDSVWYYKPMMDSVTVMYDAAVANYIKEGR